MFNFEKLSLSFSFNAIYFFIALIILAGYSIYVYKYTIPDISTLRKTFLVILRTLALVFLLFIIFEPILTLAKKIVLKPVNLIYVDNSRSIQIKDNSKREKTIDDFISGISKNNLINNSEFFEFGSKVKKVNYDSLKNLKFNEGSTNFADIFENVQNNKNNISSIVIASDGVINDGADPIFTAEKLNIPVYVLGVGDTTHKNDVEIRNILYNEYIYAQNTTEISASIINKGYANQKAAISLYENNLLQYKTDVTLSSNGIQNIKLPYTPKSGGEKKLTISISNLKDEANYENNKRTFYVKVMSNKVKVTVIAGSPSSDLSFVKNSLELDTNLTVNSLVVIAKNKFLGNKNRKQLLDSANVFFLIGFPSKESPPDFTNKVFNEIKSKNKPYFILLSNGIDFSTLKNMESELPFTFGKIPIGLNEVQPLISSNESSNPLIQNSSKDIVSTWNNLPPVYQQQTDFKAKPESNVIAKVKINNVPQHNPLIITRRFGNKKSIAVLAKDIWKWKLQTANQNIDLFDRFINNCVKWLNASEEQKQVRIKTSKKLYALGEDVEFSAQVYDQSFNPINDAEVNIKIKNENRTEEINLTAVGNGLYEGTYQTNKTGDYNFNGTAKLNGKTIGTDNGKFNVGEVDIEMVSSRMNYEFLKLLANDTGGKFYNSENYSGLFQVLKERENTSSKEKIETSEISLWSDQWFMILIILLFALEWFFRKRFGML